MDITFSPFDYHENLNQQRALFKDCFPETEGEATQGNDHYLWKFHSFPNSIPSWEYAAYLDKEMVGYYAAIPYQYQIGCRTTSVGMVCDVMTSSKHRGKGIFTKMGTYSTQELSTEVPFTTGFPIRKEVIPGHLKVGWKIPFTMPIYIKFIRLNTVLTSKKLGLIAPLANAFMSLYYGLVKTRVLKKYSTSWHEQIEEVEGYDSFIKEWTASVPNALIKDLTFAKWRYGAPTIAYKFLSVRTKDGRMIGFLSSRNLIQAGIPTLGILDYMVLPGHEDCHGLLNQKLFDCAKKEKMEAIMIMMSPFSAKKYQLCRNGFIRSPFVFRFIVKRLTDEFSENELFNESSWHLMWVDSDDL